MQVFNSINARKLNPKELNVFEGIKDNIYYIIVQSFIFIGQIIIVTFGGRAVRTQPLSLFQHICCMIIASMSLGVGYLVKLIPIDMSEKIVKTKEEIEEEKEEEIIKNNRNLKKLIKKKTKGPNLTLRRVVIPPRKRKITYNQIEIKTEKYKNNINTINDNNYNRSSSPIVIERKNMTPIFSSRGQQNNSNTNSNSNSSKKPSDSKRNIANYNIKTIYSYNLKDKGISNSNSNNISTEEKNLFEDLLSEDTKNTDNSYNKAVNEKEKDNKNNPKGKSIITPRFNNNTIFESGKNEIKGEKKEVIQNIEDKKDNNKNMEENNNMIKNDNKEEIIEDINKKQDNLLDSISEVSNDFKNLKNSN